MTSKATLTPVRPGASRCVPDALRGRPPAGASVPPSPYGRDALAGRTDDDLVEIRNECVPGRTQDAPEGQRP